MNLHPAILVLLTGLGAYVIGSTPTGMIIGRLKGVDPRREGSGNIGATNIARILGRRWGYICFVLDVAKGMLPVILVGIVFDGSSLVLYQWAYIAAGMGAVLGHVFTFWLAFRGGKGVATALGVVIGIFPYFTWPGLTALAIWVVVTLVWRYVSLGSIIAALCFAPLFVIMNFNQLCELWPLGTFASAVVILILVKHRTNIRRLLSGTENKIGSKASR